MQYLHKVILNKLLKTKKTGNLCVLLKKSKKKVQVEYYIRQVMEDYFIKII